jgi:hypothetical protein
MKKVHQLAIAMFGLIVLAGIWYPVAGQQRPREDAIEALLVEVRGLRGAIEQMASASARVQLVTSRLQLQEQRINILAARLAQQRDRLAAAESDLTSSQEHIAELQDVEPRETDPQKRFVNELQLKAEKQHLPQKRAEVERLRAEGAELESLVAEEQSRWAAINAQLDQLEAMLRK